jgi:hypothetical protein
MKSILTINLILILCLISCDAPILNTLELFESEIKLKGQLQKIDTDKIGNPIGIQVLDSSILILNWGRDYYVSVFSKKEGKFLNEFGKKGRGPNELNRAVSMDYNCKQNTLDIFTRTPKRINYYSIDSIYSNSIAKHTNEFMPKDGSCYHTKRIKNGAISTGRFNKGRYAYFDFIKDSIFYLGGYPSFNRDFELSSAQKSNLIQGLMKVSPDNDRFVFASSFAEVFEINKFQGNNLKLVKRYSFNNSDFNKGNGRAYGKRSNIRAYMHLDASEEKIFALYTNKRIEEYVKNTFVGEYLLVFDWNGKPIKKFKLDKPLGCFSYDNTDNSIYGLTLEEDIQLVKYNISD